MEKRLLLAIALALLVLLSWSAFVSKTHRLENKEVTLQSPTLATVKSLRSELSQVALEEPVPSSLFKFSQEKYDIVFIEPQAAIKEVIFKPYQNYAFPLKYGFLLEDADLIFQKEKITAESVSFVYRGKDKQIVKRFIFSKSNYNIELEVAIQNLSNSPLNINLPLILGVLNLGGDQTEARLKDVTFAGKDKITHPNPRKDVTSEEIKFLC